MNKQRCIDGTSRRYTAVNMMIARHEDDKRIWFLVIARKFGVAWSPPVIDYARRVLIQDKKRMIPINITNL